MLSSRFIIKLGGSAFWQFAALRVYFCSHIFIVFQNSNKLPLQKPLLPDNLSNRRKPNENESPGELHDGLGQSLVIIKNRAILGVEEENFEEFGEISDTASNALGEVREIIYNLRPQHLERIGLTRAIRAMLKRTAGILDYEAEIDSIDDLFPADEEIIIYRIIQECLNNIIKHSEAAKAKVLIRKLSDKVIIKVEDDGKGFDREKTSKGGFGLVGLEERVALLEGEFVIKSKIDEGTLIVIELPIPDTK